MLSAAKGVQSNNKWHWIGGWSGMGMGPLIQGETALSTSNKTNLEVTVASESGVMWSSDEELMCCYIDTMHFLGQSEEGSD